MPGEYGSDGVYESKFEFPLMKLVREKAEELDISYHDALLIVRPEYVKTIRYNDTEFENAEIEKFNVVTKRTYENWQKLMQEEK